MAGWAQFKVLGLLLGRKRVSVCLAPRPLVSYMLWYARLTHVDCGPFGWPSLIAFCGFRTTYDSAGPKGKQIGRCTQHSQKAKMPPLLSCFSWPEEEADAITAPAKEPTPSDEKSSASSSEKLPGDGSAPKLIIHVHDRTVSAAVKDGRAINKLRLRGQDPTTSVAAPSIQHGTWTFALGASSENEKMLLQANDHVAFELDLKAVNGWCQRFFPCCTPSDDNAQWKPMKRANSPVGQPPGKVATEKELWAVQVSPSCMSTKGIEY